MENDRKFLVWEPRRVEVCVGYILVGTRFEVSIIEPLVWISENHFVRSEVLDKFDDTRVDKFELMNSMGVMERTSFQRKIWDHTEGAASTVLNSSALVPVCQRCQTVQ